MNIENKSYTNDDLPESSLLNLIAQSNLSDLTIDVGEAFFDQLLGNGLVRDIPVLGIIINLAKTGKDINNYLFVKKIFRFLTHIEEIPQNQREKFITDIKSNEQFKKRVGENLLLLLDRLDDMQKAEFLSKAFKAYIEGNINYSTYHSLGRAIDRVNLDNLVALVDFYQEDSNHKVASDEIMQDLQMAGVVNFIPVTGMMIGPFESYIKNELGKLFIELIINQKT